MTEERSKRLLVLAGVWIIIIVIVAVAGKVFLVPMFERELAGRTGSESQYKHHVRLAADSFSGYAILRSEAVESALRADGIKLHVEDDKADYGARLAGLDRGELDMAVFTIDSLIAAGARLGRFPASIVMVIDETKGADAIVAYKASVGNIEALNDPAARIVLTPSSPSEFLARVMLAHFSLPSLPSSWLVSADGAQAVYEKLRVEGKTEKRAYVLWEPFVSKALKERGVHVLLDSGKLKGYIVDVLVARRGFISDHAEVVAKVVEAYLRAAYAAQESGHMIDLVKADAESTGSEKLSDEEARGLVAGIQWKNTMENYAHFGVIPPQERAGTQHLEDIIANIIEVLVKTEALPSDPLGDKIPTLFYAGAIERLHASGFHPGKKLSVVEGLGTGAETLDRARPDAELPSLSDAQWEALKPVGSLRADPISFTRGGHEITLSGQHALDRLARSLEAWPQYYLTVTGHARAEGDRAANLELTDRRAEAAIEHLASRGIARPRIRKGKSALDEKGGEAQSVSFLFLQASF